MPSLSKFSTKGPSVSTQKEEVRRGRARDGRADAGLHARDDAVLAVRAQPVEADLVVARQRHLLGVGHVGHVVLGPVREHEARAGVRLRRRHVRGALEPRAVLDAQAQGHEGLGQTLLEGRPAHVGLPHRRERQGAEEEGAAELPPLGAVVDGDLRLDAVEEGPRRAPLVDRLLAPGPHAGHAATKDGAANRTSVKMARIQIYILALTASFG
jgi:hypothetical protein